MDERSDPDLIFVADVTRELRAAIERLSLLAETIDGEGDVLVVDQLARRISDEAVRLARTIDDLRDRRQPGQRTDT